VTRFPSWPRRGVLALATIAATVAMAVLVLPAVALDTSVFELDGNAVTDHAGTGIPDDWDRVCHQVLGSDCSTTNNTNGTTALEFASQPSSGGTTFTGGGSKDPIDISSWAWNQGSGGLPGKDILLNGFAARYSTAANANCPGSSATVPCSQIFFGMDRFDNSGDAQNGFWFFQNAIGLGTASSGGGQTFVGVHKNGDLLVVSDFSIGGTTSTISVYLWNSACTAAGKPMASCADSNLQLLQTSSSANCATAASNAAFCGIVNGTNGTTAPWSFTDKGGNTSFQQGEFYEGGVDLSNFPGLATECFASTLAESRSSTSTSAVLKSFILGNFGGCTTKVTTTSSPTGSVQIGTGATGASATDSATIAVSGAGTWTGTLTFSLCGPNTGNCTTGGSQIGSPINVNQSSAQPIGSATATVTSVGTYCWRGSFASSTAGVPSGSDNGSNANECFTVTPVTPSLATTAGAGSALSGSVLLGQAVTDSASLTGTANQPGSPIINGPSGAPAGGSITFTLFGPSSSGCGSAASGPITVPVSGDGTYGPVSFTPTAVGVYHWVASYTPDLSGNTLATTHNTACTDSGEDVTVRQIATTTVTTPADLSGTTVASAIFGSSVEDKAVVTAATGGGPAVTGTVAFFVCNPGQVSGGNCATGGTAIGSVTLSPTLGSNPPQSTATSAAVTANQTGVWCFRAVYTPDTSAYTGSSDASTTECFTVNDTTTAGSVQNWLPNDTASVFSNHSAPLNGVLTIQLYDGSNDCTTGAVSGQSYSVTVSGASTATVTSNNTTYKVNVTDNLISWGVTFTSSDPNVANSFHCESSTVTINN
jgi:hypothetical protein